MQEEKKAKSNWDEDLSYDDRLNEAVRVATDITNNCEELFETYPTFDQVKAMILEKIETYKLTESDIQSITDGMAQGYAMITMYNKK